MQKREEWKAKETEMWIKDRLENREVWKGGRQTWPENDH